MVGAASRHRFKCVMCSLCLPCYGFICVMYYDYLFVCIHDMYCLKTCARKTYKQYASVWVRAGTHRQTRRDTEFVTYRSTRTHCIQTDRQTLEYIHIFYSFAIGIMLRRLITRTHTWGQSEKKVVKKHSNEEEVEIERQLQYHQQPSESCVCVCARAQRSLIHGYWVWAHAVVIRRIAVGFPSRVCPFSCSCSTYTPTQMRGCDQHNAGGSPTQRDAIFHTHHSYNSDCI